MYTASSVYGATPQTPNWGVAAPTQTMGTDPDIPYGWRGLVDPHNPLMWFGVLLVVTVGAGALSGKARVGPASVSAAIGK